VALQEVEKMAAMDATGSDALSCVGPVHTKRDVHLAQKMNAHDAASSSFMVPSGGFHSLVMLKGRVCLFLGSRGYRLPIPRSGNPAKGPVSYVDVHVLALPDARFHQHTACAPSETSMRARGDVF
jgi:hypothetical protein